MLEQVLKAFSYHLPISITKKDGKTIASGYIMIMYGSTAFRMQEAGVHPESHFVSLAEIESIATEEAEPSLL